METFGTYLKAHREKRGIRLEEIASITKIHLHTLELLEAGVWDKLPPEPFIRGFIIAYGKYVGLDPKELLERYIEEVKPLEKPQDPADLQPPVDGTKLDPKTPGEVIEQARSVSPRKVVAYIAVLLVAGLVLGIMYVGIKHDKISFQTAEVTDNAEELETPTLAEAATPTPESPPITEEKDSKPPTPEPAAMAVVAAKKPEKVEPKAVTDEKKEKAAVVSKPSAKNTEETGPFQHLISIEGKERTWIKIVKDDKPPIEYFLPVGKHVSYKAKEKIKIVLGNSTGSKIYHNGKLSEGRKSLGTIRHYRFPPDAKFPQDVSSRNSAKQNTP